MACGVQEPAERVKTYATPAFAFPATRWYGAPTSAASPETATERPNQAPAAPSAAVSSACCVQEPAERVKT